MSREGWSLAVPPCLTPPSVDQRVFAFRERTLPFLLATIVVGSGLSWTASATGETPAAAAEETKRLRIFAAAVLPDLTVRPVAKFRLEIAVSDTGEVVTETTTGFDGKAEVDLLPGVYRVRSKVALELERHSMSWDLTVVLDEDRTVELSNDNATLTRESQPAGGLTDEVDLFQRVKRSVFTVENEMGHGSGFLVDPAGLVITNQHIVDGQRYLAVKISRGQKFPARTILEDRDHDLAVVQLNPAVVAELEILRLLPPDADGGIQEGSWIIAVGSPLVAEGFLSRGIVSRVEEGVIYSDININPGNSGGPAINASGEVIGVNTFGVFSGAGPGISGIVRIHHARELIAKAKASLNGDAPPAESLPVEPEYSMPLETIRNAPLIRAKGLESYRLEVGKFDVKVITPVLIAGLEKARQEEALKRRKNRRKDDEAEDTYDPTSGIYDWGRYAGQYQPVAVIQAIPEITMTGGSKAAAILGALAGVMVPGNYRFKDDFARMRLLRDGEEVVPISRGRIAQEGVGALRDIAYFGSYVYRPEAFLPGAALTLEMYRESEPDRPKIISMPARVVQAVRGDFKTYFEALEQAQGSEVKLIPAAITE